MARVTVYYRYCPDCRQKWAEHLSQSKVTRIGKETFVCKCNKSWPTGNVEWARLGKGERRSYFLSSAEIGVLLISLLVPPLFGYFIGPGWVSALRAGAWGLAVGSLFVLFLWLIKVCIVAFSLRRCPAATQSGVRNTV